jgi:hypothetical protein
MMTKEQRQKYYKNWELKNLKKVRLKNKEWSKNHRDKCRAWAHSWRKRNLDKANEQAKKRYRKRCLSVSFRISKRISRGIWQAIRENKNGRHWETLVGFTLVDLKKHIESQFVGGMNWEAFMRGEIHIDHKIPRSRFRYKKPEDMEFKLCWSLDNLQPLWANDNLEKNDKTMEEWKSQKTA